MVSLSEIKNFIGIESFKLLSASNGKLYSEIYPQALEIFKSETGIEPVEPRPETLDWAIAPLAWISEYFVSVHLSVPNADYQEFLEFHWKEAHRILRSHKSTNRAGKLATSGEIEGVVKL